MTWKFIFIKNSELWKINEKLVMTSQFDLTRFYDVIICNSVFQLGFLTREFQIPKYTSKFSTSWYYHIWLAWPGMLKVLKITSIMQYLCNITEKWVTKLKFYMLINISFLQVDFRFCLFSQACAKHTDKFALS